MPHLSGYRFLSAHPRRSYWSEQTAYAAICLFEGNHTVDRPTRASYGYADARPRRETLRTSEDVPAGSAWPRQSHSDGPAAPSASFPHCHSQAARHPRGVGNK